MWYRSRMLETEPSYVGRPNYEETIVRSDVDRAVRHYLALKGDHDPSNAKVISLGKKVLKELENKYGNLEQIRRHMSGDTLAPAVQQAAHSVIG